MIHKKEGEIEWLEFELLASYPIVHGVFLRHGGVSSSPFESLNAIYTNGDLETNVTENRKRAVKILGLEGSARNISIHDTKIGIVRKNGEVFEGFDGLATKEQKVGLTITHADCQAAIFYDPCNHVIANIHAGFRGQVKEIYQKTVDLLERDFGSKKKDLLVCISPSLGPNHSEFKNYLQEWPEKYWVFQSKPLYFDLWSIAKAQLEKAGILPEHIQIAKMCTYENPHDFFSYRREKKEGRITGGHATIAALL